MGHSITLILENNIVIRYADKSDIEILKKLDKHICENELKNCIALNRVLLTLDNGKLIGWLRFGLFWDQIPFMNMLYFLEEYRGKGFGKQLVEYWENEMLKKGHKRVLASTLSNEQGQFFYRKLGYSDCGALLLQDEPLEIVFMKNLA